MSRVYVTTGRLVWGQTGMHPFAGLSEELEAKVDKVMLRGAQRVRSYAKDEVQANAYDTGRLWRSIRVRRLAKMVYVVMTAVPYADYVHDGTYKMAARPFFEWAMDAEGDRTLVELAAVMGVRL